MLKLRRDLDLAQEALGTRACAAKLGAQHLDGDPAVVPAVLRQVDGGHAAAAELPLDHVAVAQGVGEERVDCGHSTAWRG